MAKAKTESAPKASWQDLRIGRDHWIVLGPAEQVIAWGGSEPTGRTALAFAKWGKLVDELPEALRPSGDKATPELMIASSDVTRVTQELGAWVKTRHPQMKVKKQKNVGLTAFAIDHENSYWITAVVEEQWQPILEQLADREVTTHDVEGGRVLLWKLVHNSTVRIRVAADEIVFVDTEGDADAPLEGTPADHGTWAFRKLFAALWASSAVTDFRGVDERKVPMLTPLAGTIVKPKKQNAIGGGGGAIYPATGNFRAETGGGKKARWCRFVRVQPPETPSS